MDQKIISEAMIAQQERIESLIKENEQLKKQLTIADRERRKIHGAARFI